MKIYYYTSGNTSARLLLEYDGYPYVLDLSLNDNCPVAEPLTPLIMKPGEDIDFAFERFFKFALEPWYAFNDNSNECAALRKRTDKLIATIPIPPKPEYPQE